MTVSCLYAQKIKNGTEFFFSGNLLADAYSTLPLKKIDPMSSGSPLLSAGAMGLDTQILHGDKLRMVCNGILHKGEQWLEVDLLDQPTYKNKAWVAKRTFIREQVFCASRANWQPNAKVVPLIAAVYAKPSLDAVQFGRLSLGTSIKITKEIVHGWVEVILASGVVGCMRVSDLVRDDVMFRLPLKSKRSQVISTAKLFEKTPYRWGGCSGYDETNKSVTGVDCSGLVYLAYRLIGMHVPRDAHDQFLASSVVKFGADLQQGDLVFLARIDPVKNRARVDHVLIVVSPDLLIEATAHGAHSVEELKGLAQANVRTITAKNHGRLKKSLNEFYHGQLTDNGELIFFGTFLGDRVLEKRLMRGPLC